LKSNEKIDSDAVLRARAFTGRAGFGRQGGAGSP
jgi:hypothetical protein